MNVRPVVLGMIVLLAGCGRPGSAERESTAAERSAVVASPDSVVRFLILGDDTLSLAGKDSFRSMGARWGASKVEKTEGSGDDALRAVCYSLSDGRQEAFLILRADPHMEYPTILGFTLSYQPPTNWSAPECHKVAVSFSRVRTKQGLRLGLPIDSALIFTGASGRQQAPLFRFEFQGLGIVDSASSTADVPAGTSFSVGATTELFQRDGRVVSITAWYVEAL